MAGCRHRSRDDGRNRLRCPDAGLRRSPGRCGRAHRCRPRRGPAGGARRAGGDPGAGRGDDRDALPHLPREHPADAADHGGDHPGILLARAALTRVLEKWSRRTRRTWNRATNNGSAQLATLLVLRGAVILTVLVLCWYGHATPGDVAYVLTSYFVIHGYLRDVGFHISNLQRSVNEMEELVAMQAEPLGVQDRMVR